MPITKALDYLGASSRAMQRSEAYAEAIQGAHATEQVEQGTPVLRVTTPHGTTTTASEPSSVHDSSTITSSLQSSNTITTTTTSSSLKTITHTAVYSSTTTATLEAHTTKTFEHVRSSQHQCTPHVRFVPAAAAKPTPTVHGIRYVAPPPLAPAINADAVKALDSELFLALSMLARAAAWEPFTRRAAPGGVEAIGGVEREGDGAADADADAARPRFTECAECLDSVGHRHGEVVEFCKDGRTRRGLLGRIGYGAWKVFWFGILSEKPKN